MSCCRPRPRRRHTARARPPARAGTPPAQPLRATAEHAAIALVELHGLADRRGIPLTGAGIALGRTFSALRQTLLDRVLGAERSYRGTLLGMRHGVDVVRMIRNVAVDDGDSELVVWCDRWLDVRLPLVEQAETALSWFARHPERALERAH